MQITGPSITKDLLFLLQLVTAFGFPYSDQYSSLYRSIWALFPPNLLAVGLNLLADATSTPGDPGVSWSGRTKCVANDNTDCLITIVCSESSLKFYYAVFCRFLLMCSLCISVYKRFNYLFIVFLVLDRMIFTYGSY